MPEETCIVVEKSGNVYATHGPLVKFHELLTELADSSCHTSKSKIQSIANEAVSDPNFYSDCAKYVAYYVRKCKPSMKLPMIYILDVMFKHSMLTTSQ